MKKIFAMILCVLVMVSMCACDTPDYVETPNGETVPYVEEQKSFTYQSDEWVVTKIDVVLSNGSSYSTKQYLITMQTDEYAVGTQVDYKSYILLNVGDVISATYSEAYDTYYGKIVGSLCFNGTSFSAECYPR